MSKAVSKLAAFVFERGDMADEILFRDLDAKGELPGVTYEERNAIERAMPHLRETWIDILSECRAAFWKRCANHACEPATRTLQTRPNNMFEKGSFQVPLLPKDQTNIAGVALATWGKPHYSLYVWCSTQARYRATAEVAVEGLGVSKNDNGLLWLRLDAPKEGETYEDIGARVAEKLWLLARPIAELLGKPKAAPSGGTGLLGEEEVGE